jgi:hypothetical protein
MDISFDYVSKKAAIFVSLTVAVKAMSTLELILNWKESSDSKGKQLSKEITRQIK